MTQNLQERRILNEAIESAFIEVAGAAGSIETHYHNGRGVIGDLYEHFYFNFNILHKLTSHLEEMSGSRIIADKVRDWMRKPLPNGKKELQTHCYEGIELFEQYHTELSKNGLLALPQRGR